MKKDEDEKTNLKLPFDVETELEIERSRAFQVRTQGDGLDKTPEERVATKLDVYIKAAEYKKLQNSPNTGNSARLLPKSPPPLPWHLKEQDNLAHIYYKNRKLISLRLGQSIRYKLFMVLWNNYGNRLSYREIYEAAYNRSHPSRTGANVSAINKKVYDNLYILNADLNNDILEIDMTDKTFTLILKQPNRSS